MNILYLCTLILALTLTNCTQSKQKSTTSIERQVKNDPTSQDLNDQKEIQDLLRQVLKWAETKKPFNLLPVLTDTKDSIYIGFDLEKHKQNLNDLKATGLFASEFIENYNQIILTLDKGLKSGYYEQWLVGDLPTFIFANDVNPWCMCQDTPSGNITVNRIDYKSGEVIWKWGTESDWNFKIRVTKENSKWKVAYLQGFDFKESTRRDGQL